MKTNTNIDQKIKRQEQVEQGAYDGRFANKVIPNKKKQQNKKAARMKVVVSE